MLCESHYFDSEIFLEIMDKVNTLFNLQLNSAVKLTNS